MKVKQRFLVTLDVPGYRFQFVTKGDVSSRAVTPRYAANCLFEVVVNCPHLRELIGPVQSQLDEISDDTWYAPLSGTKYFGPLSITVDELAYIK